MTARGTAEHLAANLTALQSKPGWRCDMGNWTPGPWGDPNKPVIVRGCTFIAHAHYDTDEGKANTRLIAAAPDLLAALKRLMPTNVCTGNTNVPDSTVLPMDVTMGELRQAAAAIAKATGGGS